MKTIRYITIIYATCILNFMAKAQEINPRTIANESSEHISKETFLSLYDSVFEYVIEDKARALETIIKAEKVALQLSDSLLIVKCRRVKGDIQSLLGNNIAALQSFQAAWPIAVRHGFAAEQIGIEFGLSRIYLWLGRYDKALTFCMNARTMAVAEGKTDYVKNITNSLGLTYYKLKDYENALVYFKAS